jgi:hypothetical protein
VSPERFDPNCVSRELRNINKKFNIDKCDLVRIQTFFTCVSVSCKYSFSFTLSHMLILYVFSYFVFQLHFPIVHDHHWTLLCMNLMYKQINYMDSLQDVDKMNKSTIVDNMVYVSYFYVWLFLLHSTFTLFSFILCLLKVCFLMFISIFRFFFYLNEISCVCEFLLGYKFSVCMQ